MKVSFFFRFFATAAGHIVGHTPRAIRHYTSFWPRKCLLVVRKMKFVKYDPIFPPKCKKVGLTAGGQRKIVVVLTLKRWVLSI